MHLKPGPRRMTVILKSIIEIDAFRANQVSILVPKILSQNKRI